MGRATQMCTSTLINDEMTFILVNSETSKQQEKQLFSDWCSVNLKTKQTQCKICFTA